jgi:hypothetical protein
MLSCGTMWSLTKQDLYTNCVFKTTASIHVSLLAGNSNRSTCLFLLAPIHYELSAEKTQVSTKLSSTSVIKHSYGTILEKTRDYSLRLGLKDSIVTISKVRLISVKVLGEFHLH